MSQMTLTISLGHPMIIRPKAWEDLEWVKQLSQDLSSLLQASCEHDWYSATAALLRPQSVREDLNQTTLTAHPQS